MDSRADGGTRNPRAIRGRSADDSGTGAGLTVTVPAAATARWADVLGPDLAARVAGAAARDGQHPREFARAAVVAAVEASEERERRRAATAAARGKCQHPDKDRRGQRCGACGVRGLPASA